MVNSSARLTGADHQGRRGKVRVARVEPAAQALALAVADMVCEGRYDPSSLHDQVDSFARHRTPKEVGAQLAAAKRIALHLVKFPDFPGRERAGRDAVRMLFDGAEARSNPPGTKTPYPSDHRRALDSLALLGRIEDREEMRAVNLRGLAQAVFSQLQAKSYQGFEAIRELVEKQRKPSDPPFTAQDIQKIARNIMMAIVTLPLLGDATPRAKARGFAAQATLFASCE